MTGPYHSEVMEAIREREEWNAKHQIACIEIERLRTALQEIARSGVLPFGHPVREIAHAALVHHSDEG